MLIAYWKAMKWIIKFVIINTTKILKLYLVDGKFNLRDSFY